MEKVFKFKNPSKTAVTVDDVGVQIENVRSSRRKKIPYSSIAVVQFKSASAMFSGYIRFLILGDKEQTSGVFIVSDDENSIMFTKKQEEYALELKDIVEANIRGCLIKQPELSPKS